MKRMSDSNIKEGYRTVINLSRAISRGALSFPVFLSFPHAVTVIFKI